MLHLIIMVKIYGAVIIGDRFTIRGSAFVYQMGLEGRHYSELLPAFDNTHEVFSFISVRQAYSTDPMPIVRFFMLQKFKSELRNQDVVF